MSTSSSIEHHHERPPHERLIQGLSVAERRIDIAGVSTALLDGGEGPTTVLLHGLGGFKEEWARVIPHLVDRHRLVIPDLPGAGRSTLGAASIDASSIVEWLRLTIEHIGGEPPILVGHSLGGGVAARLAIEHPGHVSRVVLMDASSIGRPNRPSPPVLLAIVRFGARPTHANHERFLRRVLFDPGATAAKWGPDRWQAFEDYDTQLAKDKAVNAASGQLLRRVAGRRIPTDQLSRIRVPVALIWGTEDHLMRFAIAKRANERFGWRLLPIDRCGHGPHIELPTQMVGAFDHAVKR